MLPTNALLVARPVAMAVAAAACRTKVKARSGRKTLVATRCTALQHGPRNLAPGGARATCGAHETRPITITESVTSESRERVMTDPRRCRMKPIGFLPSGTVNPPECSVARWALRTTCHGLLDARASVVVPGHSQLAVQVILLARSRGDDCITSERDDGGSHSVADAQYDIPRLRAGLSRDHRGDAG
jgi:hypothetical protein